VPAINVDDAKNSLFGGVKKAARSKADEPPVEEKSAAEIPKSAGPAPKRKAEVCAVPKWKTLTKINVLMDDDQKDILDRAARKIMKSRERKPDAQERITGNTVVRALVEVLGERLEGIDLSNIDDEVQLKAVLSKQI